MRGKDIFVEEVTEETNSPDVSREELPSSREITGSVFEESKQYLVTEEQEIIGQLFQPVGVEEPSDKISDSRQSRAPIIHLEVVSQQSDTQVEPDKPETENHNEIGSDTELSEEFKPHNLTDENLDEFFPH